MQESDAAVLIGIVVVRYRLCDSVGPRSRFSTFGVPVCSHAVSRGRGSQWWIRHWGYSKIQSRHLERQEQVNFITLALKNPCSTSWKSGVGAGTGASERRQPYSRGAASNTGQNPVPKPQATILNKRSSQSVDAKSGAGTMDDAHHIDGLTNPEMFKSPQHMKHLLHPAGRGAITSTTLPQSQEFLEGSDSNTTVAHPANNNSPSQVSADISDICDNMTASLEGPTGSCNTILSSNFEGSLVTMGEGANFTPHVLTYSLNENTVLLQDTENMMYNDGVVLAHPQEGEGLWGAGGSNEATANTRSVKGTEPGQNEAAEMFFSLSDQSRDGDDSRMSTEPESNSSFTASMTSMVELNETMSMKGARRADFGRINMDTTEEKKKKTAKALSWDYTATQQLQDNSDNLFKGPPDLVPGFAENCETPSLNLIYQIMMLQLKQLQRDNKKARVASKQLQVSIRKIEKTCSEIGEHVATMESCTSLSEADVGPVAQQLAMHESKLIDIQWKMEDFENRQ
ncbi:hypothetical protein NDU88_010054 [Pleurodeles waltl]|uniref:Uncharacterized protein n=1 Tax=Pleurodeles waltl TaxID=8319 RepID=A0AAV7QXI1_PLEWA|nr:hypothetical protein NDU88_010054 [Pleurodeles waltl]